MLIAAIVLIAVGVLMAGGAVVPSSFDFAISVRPGWHVTIFPAPLWVGVVVILTGLVALLATLRSR